MKKTVTVLALAIVVAALASCNNHQAELDAAIKTNDSLSTIIQNKDSELDSLFSTLNQIEENLAAVNSRYNAVQELRRANIEGQPSVKNQISAQIKDIENLMAANKQKIASLQAKLNNDSKESTPFRNLSAVRRSALPSRNPRLPSSLPNWRTTRCSSIS